MLEAKKLIRTAQNYFPALAELKNEFYYVTRRYLPVVHEDEFRIIGRLPRRDDDLFLDVGGNRGQSILAIRKYREDVRIVSFEPSPPMFRRLSRRFGGDPRLMLENFGLGAEPAELPLFVPSYRGFPYDGIASFSPNHAREYFSPATIYGFDSRHVTVERFTCRIRTLDSLLLAPTLIKIDVEGFEHQVLLGGLNTLRQHEPVVLFEQTWVDRKIFTTFAELGYEEVTLQDNRVVRGRGSRDNTLMMTPRRIAECEAAT